MKYLYIAFILFLFSGCDATKTETQDTSNEYNNTNTISDDNNTDKNTSIIDNESLYYQQWYMDINTTFYTQNSIDEDAHIHPDSDTYEKYTGKGITVAVIDNGFDTSHGEIKDILLQLYH